MAGIVFRKHSIFPQARGIVEKVWVFSREGADSMRVTGKWAGKTRFIKQELADFLV